MKRTAVNPWPWSLRFGFNQAELVEEPRKVLFCSGQTAIDGEGKARHAGDLAAQANLALDNLDAVLKDAGMSLSNVVRLTVYTTDVDATLQNYGLLTKRFEAANVKPAQTLVGVTRLAFPELMIEIEATAAA